VCGQCMGQCRVCRGTLCVDVCLLQRRGCLSIIDSTLRKQLCGQHHTARPERTRVHFVYFTPEYISARVSTNQLSGRIDSPRTSESHSEAVSNT